MAGTPKRLVGPVALTTTYTTDIFTPPASTIYSVVTMIHIAEKAGTGATFRLYLGATGANAAGTELYYNVAVASGSYFDAYFNNLVLKSTDFLVGGASAATTLTISIFGYQVVVP